MTAFNFGMRANDLQRLTFVINFDIFGIRVKVIETSAQSQLLVNNADSCVSVDLG